MKGRTPGEPWDEELAQELTSKLLSAVKRGVADTIRKQVLTDLVERTGKLLNDRAVPSVPIDPSDIP